MDPAPKALGGSRDKSRLCGLSEYRSPKAVDVLTLYGDQRSVYTDSIKGCKPGGLDEKCIQSLCTMKAVNSSITVQNSPFCNGQLLS